jgi:phospho-N-acetylmuramoyl-pentapeptide-transferase
VERVALSATIAALIVVWGGRWAIAQLHRVNFQQRIREEAPERHREKAGTPTMGGLIILAAVVGAVGIAVRPLSTGVLLALLVTLGYGALGAADDLLAIRRRRNLGLRARERLAVQIALAAIITLYVMRRPDLGTGVVIPFAGQVELGWFYGLFAVLYIVGFSNAVNLTDGLDGLAGGTVAIAAGTYAAIALRLGRPEMAGLAAAFAGACIGFLWYNAHPAAIFMGDVGSNALGAGLAALAIATKSELILFVVGLVFVLEAASVLLQVAYFKSTGGRRLFRMSPLHHHFELSGWPETQIVVRMWLIAAFAALLGMTIIL